MESEIPQSYFHRAHVGAFYETRERDFDSIMFGSFHRAHVGAFYETRERDFDSIMFGSLTHPTQLAPAALNQSIGRSLDSPQTFSELIGSNIVIDEDQRRRTSIEDRLDVEFVASRSEEVRPIASLAEQAEPKIIELLALDQGWDGYGGIPVLPSVAACARRLLNTFAHHTRIVPDIVPLSNGGLQLEWFVGGDEFEVRIDSDCVASVFYEADREEHAKQFDLDDSLNDERIAPILQGLCR